MTAREYDGCALSYGGGVNSTALVVLLANEGWHGPILYAETGTEWPETDAYVTMFEREWLLARGLTITRIGAEWRRGKEQMTLIDYCEHYRVTPFAGMRWCTNKWKVEPIQRWCATNDYTEADALIGISAEEARRMPNRERPLVEQGIDRNACARIIIAEGLPLPRKSGCWICPFMSPRQWQELMTVHPDLFERAARLEELSSERRGLVGKTAFTPGGEYTLRQLAERIAAQGTLLDWLDYYQPCQCRI